MKPKPIVKSIGEDGNIFNLLAVARKAMIKNGFRYKTDEMVQRVLDSGSYTEALFIVMEYVEVE